MDRNIDKNILRKTVARSNLSKIILQKVYKLRIKAEIGKPSHNIILDTMCLCLMDIMGNSGSLMSPLFSYV